MRHDGKSTGLFSDEEDGHNLQEVKYKLKVDAPAETEPAEPVDDLGGFGDEGGDELFGDEPSDDKPFDDEPFDAQVEASEEEDPEKYIQQLSGKLGQSLRKYTDEQGQPDFDLEKFAINSVISATHTAEMDDEDRKEIIDKVNSSGEKVPDDYEGEASQDGEVDVDVDIEEPSDELTEADIHNGPDETYWGNDSGWRNDDTAAGWESDSKTEFDEGYTGLPADLELVDEGDPCWKGYEMVGMKEKGGKEVPNCIPIKEALNLLSEGEMVEEAEYQGKTVELNNPTSGDVKKFKVYVKNDKGNVVKVNFGDKNMEIKRDDPERRKSFRARHNCSNPGPKWKARYWSCKMWSNTPVSKMVSEDNLTESIKEHMFKLKIKKRLNEMSEPKTKLSSRKKRIWEVTPLKSNKRDATRNGKIVSIENADSDFSNITMNVEWDGKIIPLEFYQAEAINKEPKYHSSGNWVEATPFNYVTTAPNGKEYSVIINLYGDSIVGWEWDDYNNDGIIGDYLEVHRPNRRF